MFDLSLQGLLFQGVAALVVAGVYGFVVALTALSLGDKGPKYDRRLTANPFRHIDLPGFLALWLFQHGWIRRMDIRPQTMTHGGRSILVVIGMGFLALVGLALAATMLRPLTLQLLSGEAAFVALGITDTVIGTSIGTALVNLVPIPPLLAGLVWRSATPPVADRLESRNWMISLVLLAVLWSGVATGVLTTLHERIRGVLGVP